MGITQGVIGATSILVLEHCIIDAVAQFYAWMAWKRVLGSSEYVVP
jgi:hypothetical protein